MAIMDRPFIPVKPEDAAGTIWEQVGQIAGVGQQGPSSNPFRLASPGRGDPPLLPAEGVRRITYHGSGAISLLNVDLPVGVTMDLLLDGASAFYSHGNEAGAQSWDDLDKSPYRFNSTLEVVLTNTTETGAFPVVRITGA